MKPNNRQFALAQYCVASLGKNHRQLWVVPSGQGKSRMAAITAAIALLVGMFTKVHFVFQYNHHSKRDEKDFEDYWELLQLESMVEYHTGLSFDYQPRQLVIIDEADTFMLGDPQGFVKFIQSTACVCFTATPDTGNPTGSEARVVQALKFKRRDYIIDNTKNITLDGLQDIEVVDGSDI